MKQKIPKGKWFLWLLLAGRGFGKTFAGAAAVATLLLSSSVKKVALIGKTFFDVCNVMVLNGVMKFLPSSYSYCATNKCIKNGSNIVCYLFSSINANKLRGFSFDFIWMDEFAIFKNAEDIWNQVLLCLRIGLSKVIITTTPKPITILQNIMMHKDVKITKGTSYENAKNLSKVFINNLKSIESTTLGKQEVLGEFITEYSLWRPENIVYQSPKGNPSCFFLGVDPAVSVGVTGIVLVGKYEEGFFVMEDFSMRSSAFDWMKQVVTITHQYTPITLVLEINQGGTLLKEMLIGCGLVCDVICQIASKDKLHRNIPTFMLYQKKMVFHVKKLRDLEWEMFYDQKDRVDALTWALFLAIKNYKFDIELLF